MFGLGRRHRDHEARRLQALSEELEQVHNTLIEATRRAEKAESEAAFLASQNRALAAKVHRLALQRVELVNGKDRAEQEKKELQILNLQLDNEARVAKSAKADAWQVTNLKAALRQQAVQHEKKIASIKGRTKALLAAIMPGGNSKPSGSLFAGHNSRALDGDEVEVDDIWDMPLTVACPSAPDVNSRVRDIIGCLYDDAITEDDALMQMTALTQSLFARSGTALATSRGCSPLPTPRPRPDGIASAVEKVDAATEPQTVRARHVADVATETPVDMSYVGTPVDVSAAPSQGPASPQRLATAAVPVLDLASLVAQAMEDAPLSGRSIASTSFSTSGGPSFTSISQFVLAQPEKLQRLIMRHAAATGANSGRPSFSQPRVPQSSYGAGLPPSAGLNAAGVNERYITNCMVNPLTHLNTDGAQPARLSFTNRILGLGCSNIANCTDTAMLPHGAISAGNSNGTDAISTSGVVVSPSKMAKRSGTAGVPKFAKLDGPDVIAKPLQQAGTLMYPSVPGVRLLLGHDRSTSGTLLAPGEFEGTYNELSLGNNSSAVIKIGGQ
ncbi:hypothetical protein Vretimale_2731 [Volvox reticuliferus]|uniref:Uncharacterized protein n=1 Tax=Volvox reticuliferus TaxID=1737510 RepID=A0A8J4FZK2_9CHLO|nr:hypothetical protein Vretifemale_1956 [Volvox reticuliferus]GIL97014.1 hypothetical protein Vretimale_2731 [Volvox reticuliferus]